MLVRLVKRRRRLVPERLLRASDFADDLGETNNPEWKTVAYRRDDRTSWSCRTARSASAGARRANGTSRRRSRRRQNTRLRLSLADSKDELRRRAFPYFGNRRARSFRRHRSSDVLHRKVPAKTLALERRRDAGRDGVRSARCQLRRRSRLRRRERRAAATTTTSPTRPPGRRRSPACRATRSSRSRASSRSTPRRPTAARW